MGELPVGCALPCLKFSCWKLYIEPETFTADPTVLVLLVGSDCCFWLRLTNELDYWLAAGLFGDGVFICEADYS